MSVILISQLIVTTALLVVAMGLLKIAKEPTKPRPIRSSPDFLDTLNAEFPFSDFLNEEFNSISPNDARSALIALHGGILSAYNKHLQLKEKPCRSLQT